MLLHQIFEEQARLTPNALAVKSGSCEFTYQNIEDSANKVAHYLIAKGVKPGDLVAIYFKRSELPIVAMLGILKAGAAYVPIDRSFPVDRIRHIVGDAEIKIILSETGLFSELDVDACLLDINSPELNDLSLERGGENQVQIKNDDLAYIIYTSGSTGRPKGVMAQHYNVVHFVNSFKQVCRLNSKDRIYNGFAYSFDGSVEEIWMAFSCGASLIVANDEVTKLASEAIKLINSEKVTFLSTVPTFLSMIEKELHSVKLIILSGEVCPPELVNKWSKNGARMLNVYGPTETTVNTTYWECKAGAKVTIGKPIPNYDIYILNENQKPVSDGDKGELYIGGKGLAKGYLNQEELTRNTFVDGIIKNEKLYKTGDLVSLDANREILFHGRIDSQVKVRGYRIELSEIESILREFPNVSSSVVSVTEKNMIKELVAYIVLKDSSKPVVFDDILSMMEQHLPAYMIPTYLEVVDRLPLLTSGKVDKKKLPVAMMPLIKMDREIIPPSNETEKILVEAWKEVFGMDTISIRDNFFNDLGGHSLLAAKVASVLRLKHNIEIAIRDLYVFPTIEKLSDTAYSKMNACETSVEDESVDLPPKSKIATLIKAMQALSMYLIYGLGVLPMVALILYYLKYTENELSINKLIFGSAGIMMLMYPIVLLLGVALKWLIIGRIKPGVYPVNGFYYYRWWLTDRIQAFTGSQLLAGSPLMSLYYRLMGSNIGRHCTIDTHLCSSWDNISIGNNTSIGNETQLLGTSIENGYLRIGKIEIGDNCFVGIHSYIGLNTQMVNNSRLGDISALQDNEQVKADESRQGSPSVITQVNVPKGKSYKSKPIFWGTMHLFAIFALFAFLMIAGIPSIVTIKFGLDSPSLLIKIASILVSGPLAVLSFCIAAVLVKKIVFNKITPGTYKTESLFFLRKWFVDSIIRLSVMLVKPVYTTIFFPHWLRMLGAKVGKNAEISTVSQFSPELMIIGDESFFADGSIIGGRHFYNGYMEVSITEIGNRSFVGNSAILPVGTSIGDNCLIGVLSVPSVISGKIEDRTDWLGSPSFNLPRRQIVKGFDDKVIFKPTLKLYIQRYLIDFLRILIPSTIEILGVLFTFYTAYFLYETQGIYSMLGLLPLIALMVAIASTLIVIFVKWLLMGRIKATVKPLWSTFVWFNEVVNGAYESITAQMLSPFIGTPFFAPFLRLLGCKIGKNVHMGTSLFSEFDLVEIEDNVSLNAGVVIQNHLFEDRIMKASSLRIKEDCNIGNMSIVLYDSIIDSNTSVAPLSLVMKGEKLPSNSKWIGIPCQVV